MLEKAILALGCMIGVGSGMLFYWTVEHLSLPAPIFFVIDLLGALAGSIVVGLLSVPVAIGILVIVIDCMFTQDESEKGR